MVTARQIEANRRNAQKSTGPRTEEGRRVSRFNACKHGITGQTLLMTGKQAEDREKFVSAILDDLKPVVAVDLALVHSEPQGFPAPDCLRKAQTAPRTPGLPPDI